MEQPLIECVPNFSEGKDVATLEAISGAIAHTPGVRLLDVDPGPDAHRTVMTFVGAPDRVVEAAFRAMAVAAQYIDMTRHRGAHPRMGATDVCPLVPVSGISLEETAELARSLGQRVGRELGIPVYLYEAAARIPSRRNLAEVRAGEYEGLAARMLTGEHWPDFGPKAFDPRTGATAIGARKFLVAYNVNLDTPVVAYADAIAADVRESGRIRLKLGSVIKDSSGKAQREPGLLKNVKAIGWYLRGYGVAQVSMNLTDLDVTPVHVAFEACRQCAEKRGVRVTGSELVGLIPLRSLLEAGEYFLKAGAPEEDMVRAAIQGLGLDTLSSFDPSRKVLEYAMRASPEKTS
jgi:glutamate formiminotransferase/formiminotetrahydrofolate cyclodeaminase